MADFAIDETSKGSLSNEAGSHECMGMGPGERLVSLDAFRGMSIAAMILVNHPGTFDAVYGHLLHSHWNGWTATDCVFPFFLFITGLSMAISLCHHNQKGEALSYLQRQAVKRAAILFALGLFLNAFPAFHLSTVRIPGVLQRIGLCYLFTSLIVLRWGVRGQIIWLLGLLSSYWLMMEFIPAPGTGAGSYEPGRNLAAYVDSIVLNRHMWSPDTPLDPEGIMGTITAVASTLFGALTGIFLLTTRRSEKRNAALMIVCGIAMVLIGRSLDPFLPINKNLWTSTFCIFMAGLALVFFAASYWIIDIKGFKRWATPFVVLGINSIGVYVISEAFDLTLRHVSIPSIEPVSLRTYLFKNYFAPVADLTNASLLFALSFVFLMLAIAWVFWKKRLIMKI